MVEPLRRMDRAMEQKLCKPSLYENDFYSWTTDQAALLRQGRLAHADVMNIVEEIETLGRSERRELESAYRLICIHLLKMIYQPDHASRSWINTIVCERNKVETLLDDSPSLRSSRPKLFAKAYRQARKEAAAETGITLTAFPEQPPFTVEQLEDETFMPLAIADASPGQRIDRKHQVENDEP